MAAFSEAGWQEVSICNGGIELQNPNGPRYAVPIPAPISEVLTLPDGILLKCRAEQRFHHYQVVEAAPKAAPKYTYLAIVKHPYSDIYPLAPNWVNSHVDIKYSSATWPLLLGWEPNGELNLYLLRVDTSVTAKEKETLESLDPNLRDDSFGKHVSKDSLVFTEYLCSIGNFSFIQKIELGVGSNPLEIIVYIKEFQTVKVYVLSLQDDKVFGTTQEVGLVQSVRDFILVDRKYRFKFGLKEHTGCETLRYFKDLANETCTYTYFLRNDNLLLLYDGAQSLLEIPLQSILVSPPAFISHLKSPLVLVSNQCEYPVNTCVEIQDPLVLQCMSALYSILPSSLFSALQADILRKYLEARVRSYEDQVPEKARESSTQWGIFCNLILNLLKEGKSKKDFKKPKVTYSDEGSLDSGSAWEVMLASKFHTSNASHFSLIFGSEPPPQGTKHTEVSINFKTSPSKFTRNVFEILQSLHLLYENLKLNLLEHCYLYDLAALLSSIAKLLGKFGTRYLEYYQQDFNEINPNYNGETLESYVEENLQPQTLEVPSIHNWVFSVIREENPPFMPIMFETTRKICRIYECLSQSEQSSGFSELVRSPDAIQLEEDQSLQDYPIMTYGLKQPSTSKVTFKAKTAFEEIIKVLVEEKFTPEELKQIPYIFSIPIFAAINHIKHNPPFESVEWPKEALDLIGRVDIYLNYKDSVSKTESNQLDQQYEQILKLELNRENTSESISEHICSSDFRMEEIEAMLDVTKSLKMRMPDHSMSEEQFEAEKHNILFRICLRRASTCIGYGALSLGTSKASPTSASQIPPINFSALLPPNYDSRMTMSGQELETREKDFMVWPKFHIGVATGLKMLSENPSDYVKNRQWISYQRGEEDSSEHAGFIFALGLLGQLEALHDLDIYRYLRAEQESIIIAIYLGTALSAIGSMDDKIMRILRISIAFLIPPFVDIDMKLTQESASMLGFGLLYKGSGNRQVSEMLLVQLGRKPLSNKDIEREGMCLAAGVALGLVNLASANMTPGLEDLRIDERLINMFEGGRRMAPPKLLQSGGLINESKCSVTNEGDFVMTSVTAPGALLAYALIHLRTNDALIASKIQMPSAFYALEWVIPEHLMLKVLAKNLIMFDSIECSRDWVYSQIPSVIRFCFENTIEKVVSEFQSIEEIDFSVLANSYVYIIGGALLSLGFKFLGTANQEVASIIISQTNKIKDFKIQVLGGPIEVSNSNKNSIEKQTQMTVICAGALALGLVMAGTSDINSLRYLKTMRKRVENDYGYNLAVHMAIGFLSLGKSQYSFGNSDFEIAALLLAIYPKFPSSPSDNRYHLQAFRHLYVLAAQKRLLITRDAESKQLVNASVTVNYSDIGRVKLTTPVLLRPFSLCQGIEVTDVEYYYLNIDLHQLKNLELYLKKKETEEECNLPETRAPTKSELETWMGGSASPQQFRMTQKCIEDFESREITDAPKSSEFCLAGRPSELLALLSFYSF